MADRDAARRNILLLVTDQHRVDTLGCYGNGICETPALDGLAASGTRFDAAFTPTAICTPARASMVTGVHPFRHKLLANFERNVGYMEELDGTYPSFAYALRDAGYRVGHVGKWHVGKDRGPEDFGFEGTHFPGWGNPVQHPEYIAWLEAHGYPPYRLSEEIRGTFPNGQPGNLLAGVLEQPAEATFEAFLADRAIRRLHEYAEGATRGDAPFFLAVHWFGPHLPYCIPREYFERYDPDAVELPASIAETFAGKPRVQRQYSAHWAFDSLSLEAWRKLTAAYWGYVSLIDEQIGRVLDAARELGLWDSTARAVHRRPRRVHWRPPAQRQGPGDVRRHLPHPLPRPGARHARGTSRIAVRLVSRPRADHPRPRRGAGSRPHGRSQPRAADRGGRGGRLARRHHRRVPRAPLPLPAADDPHGALQAGSEPGGHQRAVRPRRRPPRAAEPLRAPGAA